MQYSRCLSKKKVSFLLLVCCFAGILVQARKNVKTETKATLDEMEEALEKAHLKCMDDHKAHVRAENARTGGGNKDNNRRKSAASAKKKKQVDSDEEEEEEEEMEQELSLRLEEEVR